MVGEIQAALELPVPLLAKLQRTSLEVGVIRVDPQGVHQKRLTILAPPHSILCAGLVQAALILELGRAGRRLDQVRSHVAQGNSQQGLQVVFHPLLGPSSVQTNLQLQILLKLYMSNA